METRNIGVSQLMNDKINIHSTSKLMRIMSKFVKILKMVFLFQAIKCTVPNCSCDCFIPGTKQIRYCETCKHGWVPHGKSKFIHSTDRNYFL